MTHRPSEAYNSEWRKIVCVDTAVHAANLHINYILTRTDARGDADVHIGTHADSYMNICAHCKRVPGLDRVCRQWSIAKRNKIKLYITGVIALLADRKLQCLYVCVCSRVLYQP